MPFIAVTPLSTPIALAILLTALMFMVVNSLTMKIYSTAPHRTAPRNAAYKPAMLFLVLLLLSLPIAMLNGVSPRDWLLRGAAPYFLFFLVLFTIPTHDPRFLLRTIIAACMIWAANVAVTIALNFTGELTRFTGLTRDLILPYNLVGISILLFSRSSFTNRERFIGIAIMIAMTLAAGYRSQIMIVVVLFAIFILKELPRGRIFLPVAVVFTASVAGAFFVSTPAGQDFIFRLSFEATADWGRAAEIRFAIEKFQSSPVFGVGLGTAIPPSVTFAGRELYADGLIRRYGVDYNVAYMHNILFYTLMSFGLFGLLTYLAIFFRAVFVRKATAVMQDRSAAAWALISLFAFNLVAATFTLLQWQVLVACLTAMLGSYFKARTESIRNSRMPNL